MTGRQGRRARFRRGEDRPGQRKMNVSPGAPYAEREIGRQAYPPQPQMAAFRRRNRNGDGPGRTGGKIDAVGQSLPSCDRNADALARAAGERQVELQVPASKGFAGAERRYRKPGHVAKRRQERGCDHASYQERQRKTERQRVVHRRQQHGRQCGQQRCAARRRKYVNAAVAKDDPVEVARRKTPDELAHALSPRPRLRLQARDSKRGQRILRLGSEVYWGVSAGH